jgi:hypothetical protein
MNFLKKFELPSEFKENFLSGLMIENAKPSLENFKVKKMSNDVQRDRSRTLLNNINERKRSKIYQIYHIL